MPTLLVLVFLSLLIFIHELGHFLAAKIFGVKVEEFGFGFPPKILGFQKGETVYSFNALPFGGFVKILGENGADPDSRLPNSFWAQKPWRKASIISAGVVMNLILAWLLFSLVMAFGIPKSVVITSVAPNSPAALAEIKPGSTIAAIIINDQAITPEGTDAFIKYLKNHLNNKITLKIVDENNKEIIKELTPRAITPPNEGPLGITIVESGVKKQPIPLNFIKSVPVVGEEIKSALQGFYSFAKGLIWGRGSLDQITGPVGIFTYAEKTGKKGFLPLAFFAAVISINLAVLNILPFPALDGGRLFFILIEKIRKKELSLRVQTVANTLGFVALIVLIIIVTIKDIDRLIR